MQTIARVYVLDMIRFCSALAVVFYHYAHRPEAGDLGWFTTISAHGYLGVPIFFMISGYVIAFSAAGRDVKAFAIARAARLYPAYWMGLLFTVGWLWLYGKYDASWPVLFSNFAMVNDIFNHASIDGVYWTLHVELRFYACVALLLLLGWFNKFHLWLPLWLSAVVIHSFTGQPSVLGWIISPAYSCYFISGVAFYLLHSRGASPWLLGVIAVSAGLCLWRAWIIVPSFIVHPKVVDHIVALVLVLAGLGLFYAIALGRFGVRRNPIYMALGALTFPLYLIHNQVGKLWLDSLMTVMSEAKAIVCVTLLMLVIAWFISRCEPTVSGLFKRCLCRLSLCRQGFCKQILCKPDSL